MLKKSRAMIHKSRFPINAWFDESCKVKKKKVNTIHKQFLKNPLNLAIRAQYFKKKREYRALITAKKVEATREIHRNLLASSRDSSAFWKLVHTYTKKCTDSSNLDALEVFSHFKKLNTKLSMEGPTICAARVVSIPELDGDILSVDVCTAIKQLKASKSPGMDGLPPSLFKNCQGKLITLITSLFNKVMSTGEYPECWSNGLICSIHKSGPKSVLDNYRGITLLNIVGKLFTTILNQRLTS